MLSRGDIAEAVASCLVRAGTRFRRDQVTVYQQAIDKERNPNARWALERILENASIARKRRLPLCDDTGIPHVFLEVGDVGLPRDWLSAITDGVAQGLSIMPGRPMAVKGDPIQRVEQSSGLYRNPAKLSPAPFILKPVKGKRLSITVLLLGGGPEIRACTYRVFHKRSMDIVLKETASRVTKDLKNLGCTPSVPAVGIGRTHTEASALMLEAMKRGSLSRQSDLEKKFTELINATHVGALGLGGDTTALGSFINIGPQRASGVRIVSVRPCCCFEPRKATVRLP